MIDYEKLELAHELAEKYSHKAPYRMAYIGIEFPLCETQFTLDVYHDGIKTSDYDYFTDMNYLIEKLKELTQPKAKYQGGDEVWSYSFGHINRWIIKDISWEPEASDFRVNLGKISSRDKGSFLAAELYPTKSALIESQIEYWKSQREDKRDVEQMLYDESKKMWPSFKATDRWYKQAAKDEECHHESTGDLHHLADGKLYHTCDKCDDYFIKCEHERELYK